MYMVKIYNSTHPINLWIISQQRYNSIVWRQCCMHRSNEGRIHKSDRTKHIPPKFFSFSQELEKDKKINIQNIRLSDNATDLFTKTLPTTTLRKLIRDTRCVARIMKKNYSCQLEGELTWLHSFSLTKVLSYRVFLVRFLLRQHRTRIQRWCTLFPFAIVLSHWVFLTRLLIRHH